MSMARSRPISFVILTIIASPALSQTSLVNVNFNAPTYTNGVLNNGADTTTPGQDGWITSGGGGTNNIAVLNSSPNGFVSLVSSGQDVRRLFNGAVSVSEATATSVFLRADINVSAAQTTGDYALH